MDFAQILIVCQIIFPLVLCHGMFYKKRSEREVTTQLGPSEEDKEILKEALNLLNMGKKTLGLSTVNPLQVMQLVSNTSSKDNLIKNVLQKPLNNVGTRGEQYMVLSGKNGHMELVNYTNTTFAPEAVLPNKSVVEDVFKITMEKKYPEKTGKGKVYHKITIIETNQQKPFDEKQFPRHVAIVNPQSKRYRTRSLNREHSLHHIRKKRMEDPLKLDSPKMSFGMDANSVDEDKNSKNSDVDSESSRVPLRRRRFRSSRHFHFSNLPKSYEVNGIDTPQVEIKENSFLEELDQYRKIDSNRQNSSNVGYSPDLLKSDKVKDADNNQLLTKELEKLDNLEEMDKYRKMDSIRQNSGDHLYIMDLIKSDKVNGNDSNQLLTKENNSLEELDKYRNIDSNRQNYGNPVYILDLTKSDEVNAIANNQLLTKENNPLELNQYRKINSNRQNSGNFIYSLNFPKSNKVNDNGNNPLLTYEKNLPGELDPYRMIDSNRHYSGDIGYSLDLLKSDEKNDINDPQPLTIEKNLLKKFDQHRKIDSNQQNSGNLLQNRAFLESQIILPREDDFMYSVLRVITNVRSREKSAISFQALVIVILVLAVLSILAFFIYRKCRMDLRNVRGANLLVKLRESMDNRDRLNNKLPFNRAYYQLVPNDDPLELEWQSEIGDWLSYQDLCEKQAYD